MWQFISMWPKPEIETNPNGINNKNILTVKLKAVLAPYEVGLQISYLIKTAYYVLSEPSEEVESLYSRLRLLFELELEGTCSSTFSLAVAVTLVTRGGSGELSDVVVTTNSGSTTMLWTLECHDGSSGIVVRLVVRVGPWCMRQVRGLGGALLILTPLPLEPLRL